MRKDPHGNPLLPRLHFKNGAYYRVHRNRWAFLSRNYHQALARYSRLESPAGGLSGLLVTTFANYEKQVKDGDMSPRTLAG